MSIRTRERRGMTAGIRLLAGVGLAALAVLAQSASVTYQYDELGRLKSVTWSDGGNNSYTLDPAGNRISAGTTMGGSGTLQLASGTYSVGEGSGTVVVAVTRANGSTDAASVTIATSNGTALAGADYVANSANLSWLSGDSAVKQFSVTVSQDSVIEAAETFFVTLSNVSGATLGTPTSATVTINDDDGGPAGTLQWISSSATVAENGGNVVLTVSRTGGSTGVASVTCTTSNDTATAGSDYTTTSTVLNWPSADAANKTCTVPILNDSTPESTEAFTATLSAASGATLGSPTVITVSITDDDSPSIPTNLRTSPVGVSFGGSYSVLWNASTGFVNHYTLHEVITFGPGTGTINDYTVTAPTVFKSFSKGGTERDWEYTIRACATADESQCSAWSAPATVSTCPSGGCN